MNITTDDLLYKIGVLTVENDVLRRITEQQGEVLQKVTKERDDLQAIVHAGVSDIEKSDENAGKKSAQE